jgi:hypothetical protein
VVLTTIVWRSILFRICDSETGQVIYETDNIQDLSDYLYDQNPKYLTVSVNEKHVKKWQASKD